MRLRSFGLLVALLFCITVSVFAGVDMQNGVIDTPSAYIAESTVFTLGISSTVFPFSGTYGGYSVPPTESNPGTPFFKEGLTELDSYFQIGLFDWVEIGVREYDMQTFGGMFKGRILKESARWPALAVGIMNLGSPTNVNSWGSNAVGYADPEHYAGTGDTESYSYYAVASKYMKNIVRLPMTVHIGLGFGRFQGGYDRSEAWNGIFGAVEYHLWNERISVISEIDGRDFNLAAKVKLPYGFTVTPYMSDIEQLFIKASATTVIDGVYYEDEYDQMKIGIGTSFTYGPLINKREQERLRSLRSRVTRAQERLKAARQRREMLEEKLNEIRHDLQGY